MKFTPTILDGAYIIDIEPMIDRRGFFARSWCAEDFKAHGLDGNLSQCSISQNNVAGTLRGMHYQGSPYEEAKLVRCTAGAIYDVIIDLRPTSPTYKTWISLELSAENRRMIYIPKGFAHGFQSLKDNSEVFYQVSEFYHPELSLNVRWNDPAFNIKWPDVDCRVISDRDLGYPDFLL